MYTLIITRSASSIHAELDRRLTFTTSSPHPIINDSYMQSLPHSMHAYTMIYYYSSSSITGLAACGWTQVYHRRAAWAHHNTFDVPICVQPVEYCTDEGRMTRHTLNAHFHRSAMSVTLFTYKTHNNIDDAWCTWSLLRIYTTNKLNFALNIVFLTTVHAPCLRWYWYTLWSMEMLHTVRVRCLTHLSCKIIV